MLKDRLYTLAPKDTRRLSAQTALWKITEALVRLVAPILSFTADEVWSYMPQSVSEKISVHTALFPLARNICPLDDNSRKKLLAEWAKILEIRK